MEIKKVMQLMLQDRPPEKGCDISYHQGGVDFVKLRASGIRAVIIRAGYGTTVDKHFISYINAAIRAGLAIGVYWFIYAKGTESARRNAEKCLEVTEPYRQYITLGVWGDWEYDSDKFAGAMAATTRSNIVNAFNSRIEDGGYEAGIYSNQDYIQSGKFRQWLISQYPLWFAKYNANISSHAYKGKNGRPYMWQYTSSGDGKAHGVSSKHIDLNRVFVDLIPDEAVPPADVVSENPDIVKAVDNPYPEPTRNVYWRRGKALMHGDDVRWVQWHLWRFGLFLDKKGIPDAGQIDGVWGEKSDEALRIAQTRLGLKQDKICGPASREMFKLT